MGIGAAVAASLALSGLFVFVIVWAPLVGLRNHPRLALVAAILGAALAVAIVLVQVVAGLTLSTSPPAWDSLATIYFLAMGNRLVDSAYPFFWTPHWLYQVGSLTPLIPAGGFLTLAAGYSAHQYARRTTAVIVALACCLLAAYVAVGWYVAANTPFIGL